MTDENLSDDPTGLTQPTPEVTRLPPPDDGLTEKELDEVEDLKARILERDEEKTFLLPDGRKLSANDFRKMSEYCQEMTQQLLNAFMHFQEIFKNAALAFTQMANMLDEDKKAIRKSERRTKIENHPVNRNVFSDEGSADPTISTDPKG